MEIEAKYTITGPLSPQTLSTLDLAPYTLLPGEDLEHHDLMLDTPDRRITGSHHALRLRDENGTQILTLKGPGTVAGSIHQREEIEAPLGEPGGDEANAATSVNGRFDYTRWPEKIARRVAELVGERAELAPLIELRVHRRTWIVERNGARVGELALDEGTIAAGGASEPVHELEVELKGAGSPSDLDALDARLRQALPLAPEPRSKLERGLALLARSQTQNERRHEQVDTSQSRSTAASQSQEHSDIAGMTGHTPLQLATRHAIGRYLHKLRKQEQKVRDGHDPDAIHDMRVATRRIRAALDLLEDAPGFDAKELRTLRRHLRPLAHKLGAVRDLDVFLARLGTYEDDHPDAVAGLHGLRQTLERRREKARAKLLRELDSAKLHRRLQRLEDFATQPVDITAESRPVLVRHYAASAIWRRYEDVLRFECELPGAPLHDMHRLRISCKHARYALELFAQALGDATQQITDSLVAAQDHLGALQDSVVALATIEELRADHDGHRLQDSALATYADALALRRDSLRGSFAPLWQRISAETFREELASLLAGL